MGNGLFWPLAMMFAFEGISFAAPSHDTAVEQGFERIAAILRQTPYWTVEYLADSTFTGGAYVRAAPETLSFTEQGDRWLVTIAHGYRGTCVTDVTLAPNGFAYTGCFLGDRNEYRFDPEIKKYPFRAGEGPWAKRLTAASIPKERR